MPLFLRLMSLWFWYFLFFSLFSFLFYLFFFYPFHPPFIVHSYCFLYYLPQRNLPFLLLNYFWLLMGVLPRLPTGLSATQSQPLLWMCWLHHSPFPNKISCLVSYFSLFFHFPHLDKDQTSPLPTSMACIKWSQPTFNSFGCDAIPTGHPSSKKFEREPQNRPLLSPHRQTTPFEYLEPCPTSHALAGYK